jgi:hypothetical protein
MVRVVSYQKVGKVAPAVRPITLDQALDRWRKESLEAAEKYVTEWASDRGVSRHDVHVGLLLRRLVGLRLGVKNLEAQSEQLKLEIEAERIRSSPETSADSERRDLLEDELSRTNEEMRIQRKQLRELEDQVKKRDSIGSELVGLSVDELQHEINSYLKDTPAATQVRRVLELQNEWADRFGKTNEFAVALLVSSQLVAGTCVGVMNVKGGDALEYDYCILDEASKATPTEALVPIARARKFIVVGDPRQLSPFQDPELKNLGLLEKYRIAPDDAKRTLLDVLLERLPEECRTRLSMQHRMVKEIGDLISTCFYDDQLQSSRTDADRALRVIVPKPVTWISTSGLANRFEDRRQENPCEAAQAMKVLERIQFIAATAERRYSVALLTGYASQRAGLQRALAARRAQLTALDIDVNTVDAFQGREADIAVYSVTRSNPENKVGFLAEDQRINVALSRGRDYLIIVGDHTFCRSGKAGTPLKRVADYVDSHPESCARIEAQS